MDEEKMQRQMEFIVEQQAQFAVKIGQIEKTLARQSEAAERLNAAVERQGENIERLSENVERLGEYVERLTGIVGRVADAVGRLTESTRERFDDTDRKIAALVDSQIQTEENLRSLSAAIDRHIAEGHNGRARPGG